MNFLTWLDGKKTYVTCAALGLLMVASWQGWIKVPTEVSTALTATAIAFLRLGVSKSDS